MSRNNDSFLDAIVEMPWPWGFGIGLAAFFLIRYGIAWYFVAYGGPIGKSIGDQLLRGTLTPIAVICALMCWTAAAFSYRDARRRRHLLEAQTGLESIASTGWQNFERLVGEAFRRRGYAVEETGLGGADGGIDLILRKDGRKELVQCKQWRSRQVKASVVREIWGLVAHHKADGAKIVCSGTFTPDANEFAQGKSIELIPGDRFFEMIREVQTTPVPPHVPGAQTQDTAASVPPARSCPKCGSAMVRRTNRLTKEGFWGCSKYPKCRATLPASNSRLAR